MVELSVLFLITSNFWRRDPWFRSFIGRSLFSQRKLGKKTCDDFPTKILFDSIFIENNNSFVEYNVISLQNNVFSCGNAL